MDTLKKIRQIRSQCFKLKFLKYKFSRTIENNCSYQELSVSKISSAVGAHQSRVLVKSNNALRILVVQIHHKCDRIYKICGCWS